MLCPRAVPPPPLPGRRGGDDEPPEFDLLLDDLLDMSDAYTCSTDVLRLDVPAQESRDVCGAAQELGDDTEPDLCLSSRNEVCTRPVRTHSVICSLCCLSHSLSRSLSSCYLSPIISLFSPWCCIASRCCDDLVPNGIFSAAVTGRWCRELVLRFS